MGNWLQKQEAAEALVWFLEPEARLCCLPLPFQGRADSHELLQKAERRALGSGNAGSRPGSASHWLCDLKQIPPPLSSLVSSFVKRGV